MSLRLDRKGMTMLGYGIVDVEITKNNVWLAAVEPVRDGQYTMKLKELIAKVIREPEARDIYEEILNYKWLQTENLVNEGRLEKGSSLTLKEAASEWIEQHYPEWKSHRKTLLEVTTTAENDSCPEPEETR
jgi:hypothetical protein